MDKIDKIFIINLAERQDRWIDIMEEMEEFQVPLDRIERFNAIKHEKGYMGCTMSHLSCLKIAKERRYNNVLILEDDFSFHHSHYPVGYQDVMRVLEEIDFEWNVLFWSANVLAQKSYHPNFDRIQDAQTTSGYMVHHRYFNTLIQEFENCVSDNGFIDIHWKHLQKKDSWFIFQKKIGYQRQSYSDIEERFVHYDC
jgi:GR25 family glycosyltransferase involved in LPS biosynthesis